MASGGGDSGGDRGSPSTLHMRTWANVVKPREQAALEQLASINQRENLEKLKKSVNDVVIVAKGMKDRANRRMINSLFSKFLGKAPPLEMVKASLSEMWRGMGPFSVSDMSNGFYLIRCEKQEMVEAVMWERLWTISGMVLQLTPWKGHFQPAFEKLHLAAVWVQLHHLPIEYWNGEVLELVGEQFGRFLKVDDHTEKLTRTKFARICVEIILSKPLKRGFWIGDHDNRCMVAVFYERLPVFCFKCGLVGHGESGCPPKIDELGVEKLTMNGWSLIIFKASWICNWNPGGGGRGDQVQGQEEGAGSHYSPWLMVQRHRGRGRGRQPGEGENSRGVQNMRGTWPVDNPGGRHVGGSPNTQSFRGGRKSGRGGHVLLPRDSNPLRSAEPHLPVGSFRDLSQEKISKDLLNCGLMEPPLEIGKTDPSVQRP